MDNAAHLLIPSTPIRYAILAVSLAAIVVWLVFARKSGKPAYALAACLYLGNLALFSLARLCAPGAFDLQTLNIWSLAIHLQAALTLLLFGIFLAKQATQ